MRFYTFYIKKRLFSALFLITVKKVSLWRLSSEGILELLIREGTLKNRPVQKALIAVGAHCTKGCLLPDVSSALIP